MPDTPRILFMDDEPASDVVINAVERLREAGFAVDFVETLDEAVDAYYRQYYAVFVLDIDMSHQAVDQEGDGVQVLRRFVSLHNGTCVILFSGAGTVQHWFQAANAHCHAYIHKLDEDPASGGDSIDWLARKVREAVTEPPERAPESDPTPPARLLLVGDDPALKARAAEVAREALGTGWGLDDTTLAEAQERDLSAYGALVIVQRVFSTRSTTRQPLARLLAAGPRPQVVVCCEGRDEYRPSILDIANRHPFRLLDLADPQWPIRFREALRDARECYGRRETFEADVADLGRLSVTPPDDFAEWEDAFDDLEQEDGERAMADDFPPGDARS